MRSRRFGGVVLVLGLAGGVFAYTQRTDPEEVFCYSDGLIAPDGSLYGRDSDRGCQFVDADGDLVTHTATGEPICYSPTAAIWDCDLGGVPPTP